MPTREEKKGVKQGHFRAKLRRVCAFWREGESGKRRRDTTKAVSDCDDSFVGDVKVISLSE